MNVLIIMDVVTTTVLIPMALTTAPAILDISCILISTDV